jgi:hypothetical protein
MSTRPIMTATAALVLLSMAAGNAQVSSATRAGGVRAAVEDGWWIRLNAESEATALRWWVKPDPKAPPFEIMWEGNHPTLSEVLFHVPAPRRSVQTVIDFPATHRSLRTFKLEATAEPPNAKASFCVFFKNRGVELFEFSGSRQSQLTQKQSERKCIP